MATTDDIIVVLLGSPILLLGKYKDVLHVAQNLDSTFHNDLHIPVLILLPVVVLENKL